MPDIIRVVAAVVESDGRWLLGRRPPEKRHGDLFEFPGGKLDEGESPLDAARRELAEELALRVESVGRTLFSVRDPGSPFVIDFVEVVATGTPTPNEHTEVGWFGRDQLAGLPLAPADAAFVDVLLARRPDRTP